METDRRIREAIEEEIRLRGLSGPELARLLGVTKSHVYQILGGNRAKIPLSLIRLLDALGLELVVRKKR